MQKYLCFLCAALLTVPVCMAQFSATGGSNGTPYVVEPADYTHLDKVFIYNGLNQARISFAVSNPADWTWYRYEKDPATAVAVPGESNATETVLNNVEADCGYMVVSSGGSRHYIYVVGYKPVEYNEIRFATDGDVCNSLRLIVLSDAPDMYYYTDKGNSVKLDRKHTLSWNTLEFADHSYQVITRTSTSGNLAYWSVDAPLTDTYFTVTGDQYAESFGIARSFKSGLYKAVAVKANAQAELQERTARNEIDRISTSGELSGSAPLDVRFFSNPTDAVLYKEWFIYETPEVSNKYIKRTEEDISYSFRQSGTFLVRLFVSNATCKDSASFNPQILESFIDCPNFFTPRSSPGENDEFRVAYKSIIAFKGTIVNRWGNVLFEWTDPALGWNGTYKGKAVSPGVYFYVIEAKGSDGVVYKKKGDINLLE